MTIYEKACNGKYIEKYSKRGNLIRVAEQFNNNWVVFEYSGKTNIQGEYSEKEFKDIRKRFF